MASRVLKWWKADHGRIKLICSVLPVRFMWCCLVNIWLSTRLVHRGRLKISCQGMYSTSTSSLISIDDITIYRYLKKQVWTEIFNKLLNIKDIKHLPDLNKLKTLLDNEIWSMESELNANIRTLKNLVKPTTIKRTNRRTMNKSNMNNSTLTNLDSTLIAPDEDSSSQPGV